MHQQMFFFLLFYVFKFKDITFLVNNNCVLFLFCNMFLTKFKFIMLEPYNLEIYFGIGIVSSLILD